VKYIHKNTSETNLNKWKLQRIRMPPYTPPSTHYSQMDVSEYDEDHVFAFVGKTGKKFYWLTRTLGLDYLWYDRERKVIEIWGSYYTHMNRQSEHIIRCELDYFMKPKLERSLHKTQDDLLQAAATANAC